MKQPGEMLASIEGEWVGVCRTWVEPDKLSDESPVRGRFLLILGGGFLRHEYEGSYQGRPRHGEETIVFNPARNKFESSWIDTFHMSQGVMYSAGDATRGGFFVVGRYGVAPGRPDWGWRTEYDLSEESRLKITAYNIAPTGEEDVAVETVYDRQ